jgi:hypothetical protein
MMSQRGYTGGGADDRRNVVSHQQIAVAEYLVYRCTAVLSV